jgi:hypothetical protein
MMTIAHSLARYQLPTDLFYLLFAGPVYARPILLYILINMVFFKHLE